MIQVEGYTSESGLLAFFEEKKISRPVNDNGNEWALSLILEWDELSDFKKFEYLTKVIDAETKIKDSIINSIDVCRIELDEIKLKMGDEQFIVENKDELDTEQLQQLDKFLMNEIEEGFKEYEEFSFRDKQQAEPEIKEKIEQQKIEQKEQEQEEKKIDLDVEELKSQAKQKVRNTRKKQNQQNGRKKQNNTKNQKQNAQKQQTQQQAKQIKENGQLILKKELQLEKYINHYIQQLQMHDKIRKSKSKDERD